MKLPTRHNAAAGFGNDVTVIRTLPDAYRPSFAPRSACVAWLVLSLAVASGGIAHAEEQAVTGEIEAFLVTQSAEGEQLVEASEAAPGEIMEFRIEFTNAGDESVTGVRVVDSIPENTRFVGDSHAADVAAVFEVSIDGGESFEPEPVTRIETQADGTQTEVVIPPAQYTHLRWISEEAMHADGGTQAFTYRVAVN